MSNTSNILLVTKLMNKTKTINAISDKADE
jgi:hypothetical protein